MNRAALRGSEANRIRLWSLEPPEHYGRSSKLDGHGRAISIEEKAVQTEVERRGAPGSIFYDNDVLDIAASLKTVGGGASSKSLT